MTREAKSVDAEDSHWVIQRWRAVLVAWLALAVLLRFLAPEWEDIAADGDLAFLPKSVPSAMGQQAVEAAFPATTGRSQFVCVLVSESGKLSAPEKAVGLEIARRLHWMAAKGAWQELSESSANQDQIAEQPYTPIDSQAENIVDADAAANSSQTAKHLALAELVRDNVDQVIEIEEALVRFQVSTGRPGVLSRLPDSFQLRGQLLAYLGEQEASQVDMEYHKLVLEQAQEQPGMILAEVENVAWADTVRDVWTWRSNFVGHKLGANSQAARLVAVQLRTELTATRNINVVDGLEDLIEQIRADYADLVSDDFLIEYGGSAAVGADMLRAAANGVKKTEIVTVILVLAILISVYRSIFLVSIPILSIALSLFVSTSLVAMLARDPSDPTSLGIGVFTTTRIFIVVLLFGAGTDFCMFFLARCKELHNLMNPRSRRELGNVLTRSWHSTKGALTASAFTTIVGLALMWFSRFEKFQFSGPIIAICLAVTLLVCLTFTPALLFALGGLAFGTSGGDVAGSELNRGKQNGLSARYWEKAAELVTRRPLPSLLAALVLMSGPAIAGFYYLGEVTYDLTEELSASAPSRRGATLIKRYFPAEDASPITLLISRGGPFENLKELQDSSDELTAKLYIEGVRSVRSLTDPLGDYPPGKRIGLFEREAWRKRFHRIAQEKYVSPVSEFARRVARFDVLIEANPFSLQASRKLGELVEVLEQEVADNQSPWFGATVFEAGTTVGITDLRNVTQGDQTRIQFMVTLGVWLVLLCMLRRLVLCSYLIFTVLLGYFTTLGVTYLLFAALHAGDYSGLDWKVPIFLFVILVAVGQDYNVYLVTRIFEEQSKEPELTRVAVRVALQRTGGIITSCGFVMSGTFAAMMGPAILHWLAIASPAVWGDSQVPVLRGMTELGFALSFGVLLDTLVIRSFMVPAFVVLFDDWQRNRSYAPAKVSSDS